MPAGAMQAEVNGACAKLKTMNLDINLQEALTGTLTPDDVRATMAYIAERQARRPATETLNDLSTTVLTFLKTIRTKASTNVVAYTINCTGAVDMSYCMCLFVCGLLTHPSMSFLGLVQENKDYANQFFDYMIKNAGGQITVEEYTSASQAGGAAVTGMFDVLNPQGTQTILGTCFI
jgi:hypothetical protein